MLKKSLLASAVALATAMQVSNVSAAEQPRHFNVGVASFATSIAYDDGWVSGTDTYGGLALFFDGAINNNVAARLSIARQTHEDDSAEKLNALEASVLLGTGMTHTGLKAYGSLGFYNETLEYYSFEEDFSGLMFGGGVGYNWRPVALELWLNIRETSDYESFAGSGVDIFALSAGLGLSARF